MLNRWKHFCLNILSKWYAFAFGHWHGIAWIWFFLEKCLRIYTNSISNLAILSRHAMAQAKTGYLFQYFAQWSKNDQKFQEKDWTTVRSLNWLRELVRQLEFQRQRPCPQGETHSRTVQESWVQSALNWWVQHFEMLLYLWKREQEIPWHQWQRVQEEEEERMV